MKCLVVGLGSMGKRRLGNLRDLEVKEILGCDLREDRRKQAEELFRVRTYGDFEEALEQRPDAVIISTPPDLHVPHAMEVARRGIHLFMEASVVSDGMEELIDLSGSRPIVAAPSCTMRFHPSVVAIREVLESKELGRPLCFTYHFGQYLPDWHPWEDYRAFYAGRRKTGGSREMVAFMLVWLTWVFGDVTEVACFRGKLTDLDVDIDDVYQLVFRFRSGVLGHMLSEVTARIPYRTIRIMAEDGVIEWDWRTQYVRVFTAKDGKWQEIQEGRGFKGFHTETVYLLEMGRFLRAIRAEEPFGYTLLDDRKVLRVLEAGERSADTRQHVRLE